MGKFVWRHFRKNDTCCHRMRTLYYLIIRSIELVVSLIRKTVVIRWKCLIIFSVHSTRQGANTCVCALTSNVVRILDVCVYLSSRLLFHCSSVMINVQLASSVSIVPVCLWWWWWSCHLEFFFCLFCWIYKKKIRSNHLESVSIHQ